VVSHENAMSTAITKGRNYQDQYRCAFASLGFPLMARDGITEARIAAAERKLGVGLPGALRDYYLVAGKERSLNHAHNHLCAPDEWEIHSRKLIFMEERQAVVVWGVSARSDPTGDPPVFQGTMVDDEPSGWYREHAHCSAFLVAMLYWHAALGGMARRASAAAPKTLRAALDHGLQFTGEVNGMRAYRGQGGAVCFLKWESLIEKDSWRVFAGAGSKNDLGAIANNLGLQWD
jgi:hypothetical protein